MQEFNPNFAWSKSLQRRGALIHLDAIEQFPWRSSFHFHCQDMPGYKGLGFKAEVGFDCI